MERGTLKITWIDYHGVNATQTINGNTIFMPDDVTERKQFHSVVEAQNYADMMGLDFIGLDA